MSQTQAFEFRLTVNDWLADLDAQDLQDISADINCQAVHEAPLSHICGSALVAVLPTLRDESVASYARKALLSRLHSVEPTLRRHAALIDAT